MNGLTSSEVEERKKNGQVNGKQSAVSRSYLDIVYKNLVTPFNIVLFILGISLLLLGNLISSISATGIILVNIIISTIQEMRAKRRLDKIAVLTRPKVTVIRDGEEKVIDQSEIVKDDLIVFRAGEQALVDGTLVKCTSLEMDESLLTGESSTVRKNEGDLVYSGSVCITGEGYYNVTAFGDDSYASKILAHAKKFTTKKTPLQMETQTITTVLMGIAFVLLALSVLVEILKGVNILNPAELSDILEIFVICLDVVPIALFLLITLTYMIAAIRMASTGVLLQQSNAVESISHVDTVCMDKTGTITTNNLLFESAKYMVDEDEAVKSIRLFSNSTGSKNKTVKTLISEYGEIEYELLDEIQFSSDRKYSAVKVKHQDEVRTLYSGAWNVIREHIASPEEIDELIKTESSKGLRTLVLCSSEDKPLFVDDKPQIYPLTPVAVISIKDEVRPDCRETIDIFLQNGMDLKVISGDDPATVDSLFSIADIPGERRIISGPELEKIPEDKLDEVILNTNIFGRMRPENKEMVITRLKQNGRYVAMIGDGVNDVRSLKTAQVGVSLESGAGAARGVADMILVDDNFAALPKALVEGRRTVSGVRDILKIYLTRNFALAIMFMAVFFFVGSLPMLPIQNLVYAFISVTVIAFFMTIFAKPDDNKELILPEVIRFCIPASITITVFAVIIYVVSWTLTASGAIVLDLSYLEQQTGFFKMSVEEIIHNFLVWHGSGADMTMVNYPEIVARNCLVLFASIVGALMIFIVCPRYKFLSTNGKTNKSLLPPLLVLLLMSLVAIMYMFVPIVATIVAMVVLPPEGFLLVVVMVAICFFTVLMILKRDLLHKTVGRFEEWYLKKLQKEYTKEDSVKDDKNRP